MCGTQGDDDDKGNIQQAWKEPAWPRRSSLRTLTVSLCLGRLLFSFFFLINGHLICVLMTFHSDPGGGGVDRLRTKTIAQIEHERFIFTRESNGGVL